MKTRVERCETCRFWELSDNQDSPLGLCRCQPPAYEGWPLTEAQDWCGKWQKIRDN